MVQMHERHRSVRDLLSWSCMKFLAVEMLLSTSMCVLEALRFDSGSERKSNKRAYEQFLEEPAKTEGLTVI